ncbi:FadR/GntR family transcriptional regulator [Sphingobacterium deserti]|uniref:FadR/GntR family transcriptional regulator n=1 Tax=Sphingobacterium deserti TaxID=1229276 RepID=UPI0005682FEA|nr:FadR/GntR family transcriptional regulator [Sphingobacterium deserti]
MIKRTSLAEEVSEQIKTKIKSGEYALSSRLPTEPELMQSFGVGRSSVREAIRMLSNLGYLDVQQGVGTFVTDSDGNESLGEAFQKAPLADLMEVRQLLEIRIAEKAAEHRTAKDLKRIAEALRKRKEEADAGALVACIEADIAFHQAIANACGNPILTELYSTSSKHVSIAFKQIYANTAVFISTQVSHEQLFLAIEKRDAVQARALLNEIIEAV